MRILIALVLLWPLAAPSATLHEPDGVLGHQTPLRQPLTHWPSLVTITPPTLIPSPLEVLHMGPQIALPGPPQLSPTAIIALAEIEAPPPLRQPTAEWTWIAGLLGVFLALRLLLAERNYSRPGRAPHQRAFPGLTSPDGRRLTGDHQAVRQLYPHSITLPIDHGVVELGDRFDLHRAIRLVHWHHEPSKLRIRTGQLSIAIAAKRRLPSFQITPRPRLPLCKPISLRT